MSAFKPIGFALLLLFVSAQAVEGQGITKPAVQIVDGGIDWVYDYEKGKALSEKSSKPMFVVFRCER